MSGTGADHVLVELQLVAAGLCLSLAFVPARRRGPGRGWLVAWQLLSASILLTNYLLFVVADDAVFDVAMYVRALLFGAMAVLVLGVVRAFTERGAPAWVWLVALLALAARVILWPTTDLFYEGRNADGTPAYGPWSALLNVPVLVVVGLFVVHALATAARPDERTPLAVAFGFQGLLLGLSAVLTGPTAELLAGYQSVPAVVTLQVLSARRSRAIERAVRRLWRQRVRASELAQALQGAEDLDAVGRLAAHAIREMLEADDVEVTLGTLFSRARATPADRGGRDAAVRTAVADLVSGREPVVVRAWRHDSFEESERRLVDTVRDVVGATVERIRAEDELRHRALHDELTGLANRTLLDERLGAALVRARRNGLPVTVLFADLDGFKDVNDEHGHPVGDALLRRVADRLTSVVREGDTVARFGGDEFVVVCEGVTVDSLPEVANRILTALNGDDAVEGLTLRVRGSIGVAVGGDDADPHALLRDADTAMYRAKQLGGGRLEIFDASRRSVLLDRIDLERRIPQAVARQELVLHYQPIQRLADGEISHVEALSRWEREGTLAPPDSWIPAAEHTGAIDGIGAWVLREASRRVATDRSGEAVGVAVNVSPYQLRRGTGLSQLVAAVREAPIEPGRIWLEVTESAITDAAGRAALDELCGLGVRIALDDFGTGYSSLSALSRLPVDVVKIDRTFIHRLTDPDGRAVVRAVVQLMNDLSRDVVAEGIETQAQLDIARELGCTYGQGFLLGRPAAVIPGGRSVLDR